MKRNKSPGGSSSVAIIFNSCILSRSQSTHRRPQSLSHTLAIAGGFFRFSSYNFPLSDSQQHCFTLRFYALHCTTSSLAEHQGKSSPTKPNQTQHISTHLHENPFGRRPSGVSMNATASITKCGHPSPLFSLGPLQT